MSTPISQTTKSAPRTTRVFVDLPNGRRISKTLPVDYTDDQIRAAFADDMRRNGFDSRQQSVITPKLPKAPPAAKAPVEIDQEPTGDAERSAGFEGAVLDTILPNSSANLAGVGAVIGNGINYLTGRDEWRPGEVFDQRYDQAVGDQKQWAAENPNKSMLGTGVGFGGSFLLPEAKIFKGGGWLSGAGNAGLNGAGWGAVTGFLNGQGDRVKNMINGAAGDMAFSSVFAPVTRLAGHVGSGIRNSSQLVDNAVTGVENFGRRLIGAVPVPQGARAQRIAETQVARTLDGQAVSAGFGVPGPHATPQNVADEVISRQRAGTPAMVADVNENTRRLAQYALSGNGQGSRRAREAVIQRKAGERDRVRGHLNELGPATDVTLQSEQMIQQTRDRAGREYPRAFNDPSVNPMDYRDPNLIEIMQRPAFQSSLRTAHNRLINQGIDPRGFGLVSDPNTGIVGFANNAPTFQALHEVQSLLGREVRNGTNKLTGQMDQGVIDLAAVQRDLQSHLRRINPTYDRVTNNYADDLAQREALERGRGFVGKSGEEVQADLRNMPRMRGDGQEAMGSAPSGLPPAPPSVSTQSLPGAPRALPGPTSTLPAPPPSVTSRAAPEAVPPAPVEGMLDQYRLGVNSSVRDVVNNGKKTTPVAENVHDALGEFDPAKLDAVRQIYGDEVADSLFRRLENEKQQGLTFNSVFGNSATQPRQAFADAVESGNYATAAAMELAKGNKLGAIWNAMKSVTGYSDNGNGNFKEQVQNHLAAILTETNPQTIQEMMQAVASRANADREFAELLSRAGVKVTGIASRQIAGADPDPQETYRATLPDGSIARVSVPKGASEQEVRQAFADEFQKNGVADVSNVPVYYPEPE